MEFYRIWRILAGHKWLLIWLPLVASIVAVGVTYVLPEQYEGTALVLAKPFEDIKFSSDGGGERKEIRDFPVNLSAPIDGPSKTYMEVIKSPAVAAKIVEALQLDVPKPVQFDTYFDILKDEVKTWVKETLRTLRNYARYGRDIPASRYELAVEGVLENILAAVRKDTYAFDITFRSSDPREAAAVANMAAEIFIEHSSLAYRGESARVRDFFEGQVNAKLKILENMRAEILEFKNSGETFELVSEYTEKLKIVTDLENTVAKIEGKLAGDRTRTERPQIKFSPTVVAEEAEIAEYKEQISALRTHLASYPGKSAKLNALLLNERLAAQSYEFFLKRFEEARVKEASTANEIRIVSRAVPGLYPVKPQKYIFAGVGFATALVLAIGWVLFFEALDPRIRAVRDLNDELGLPVLGTIPVSRTLKSW